VAQPGRAPAGENLEVTVPDASVALHNREFAWIGCNSSSQHFI
jgi:hypothetical protein